MYELSKRGITFLWSKDIEKFFEENHIYLDHPEKISGIYQMGERVFIPKEIQVEPHSTLSRKSFHNIGSFLTLLAVDSM